MKIFVDANVLFTAAYSHQGKAATLIETLAPYIVTSDYAVEEVRRNILAKSPSAIQRLQSLIVKIQVVPSPSGGACPIKLPKKDRPIFLSALMAKATHLLTGDLKDFGPYMNKPQKTSGITIQTVTQFLEAL